MGTRLDRQYAFFGSRTGAPPTNQSLPGTSSITTQIASLGSSAISLIASVTRREISFLRFCEWPSSIRMLTNGMGTSPIFVRFSFCRTKT